MKFPKSLLLITFLPAMAFASGRAVLCDEPMGPRLDYFTQNTANLQNNQFLVGRDQMTDMHVRVVFSDNNQDVAFAVGNTAQLQSMPIANNMKVIETTKDQISFIGKVNDAPILSTYYPMMDILIYTQQSVWPGDSFSGARAMLFYARCHDMASVAPATPVAPAQPAEPSQEQTPTSAPAPAAQQVEGLATPPDAVPPADSAVTSPAAAAATPAAQPAEQQPAQTQ